MQPLVSIIIPAYNAEQYLLTTLNSVFNQSQTSYELIVIDDNSFDSTYKIAYDFFSSHQFNHQPILLKNIKNYGCATSRNIGIHLARGKYICFLDADDWYHSTFLQLMTNKISSTQSDIVFCGYDIYNSMNETSKKYTEMKKYPHYSHKYYVIWCYMIGKTHIGHWAALYDAAFLRKMQIYYYDGCKKAADTEFVLNILLTCKKITIVNKSLYTYNIHPNSITTSRPSSDIFDGYYAYRRIFKKIKNPLIKILFLVTKYPRETYIILERFYYNNIKLPYLYTSKYKILFDCILNIIVNKKPNAFAIFKWFYADYFKTK